MAFFSKGMILFKDFCLCTYVYAKESANSETPMLLHRASLMPIGVKNDLSSGKARFRGL